MAMTPTGGERKWLGNFPSWVEKCAARHAGKYQYPSSARKNVGGKWFVEVLCPVHGAFWQAPEKHAFGQGCPKCSGHGTDKVASLRLMMPSFAFQDDLIVGNTKTSFSLTCPKHGDFQTTYNRLATKVAKGTTNPCPKCNKIEGGVRRRKDAAKWAVEIEERTEGRFALDQASVSRSNEQARFTCAEHGEFNSILQDVLSGHGCPKCGTRKRTVAMRSSAEEFAVAAAAVHGDRYTYHLDTYVCTKTPMAIECKEHGVFWQRPNNHVSNAAGCPICASSVSSGEEALRAWLTSTGVTVVSRERKELSGKEIDIFLPEYRIGVEYCGLYWHGEHHKDAGYHQEKQALARSRDIRLITVFEDEWLDPDSRSKVLFRLLAAMGASRRVAARKTEVRRIEWVVAREFLDTHHMQGAGAPAKLCYGLFLGVELVCVSTWGTPRFSSAAQWELLRFSAAGSDRVVGGLGKMFARFVSDNEPQSVITYADLRWGYGETYRALGFSYEGVTAPGYFWCKASQRFGRHDFQKHKLAGVLKVFDPAISEVANCHLNKYWRIFDCGHSRWLWTHERKT